MTRRLIDSWNKSLTPVCVALAAAMTLSAAAAPSKRGASTSNNTSTSDDPSAAANASSLLEFTQVPHIFTQSPELFRSLLLERRSTPTRIAFLGDSTTYDHLGAGSEHMNWRRWLWHQYHGHTPATQLSRSSNMGGSPTAEFMLMGGPLYAHPSVVPTNFLPPGFVENAAKTFSRQDSLWAGMHIQLNHTNDNHITHDCPTWPNGFYYVPPAIDQGIPGFASGTMSGGRSLIDVASGLRVEVLAVRHPNSASTVGWGLAPQTEFCDSDPFAPVVQNGVLFGGAQSLAGPVGAAFRATTPLLAPLSGANRFYRVVATGNTTLASESVQIIGARFISDNPAGLIIDSFSKGGYTSQSMLTLHPQCGYVIAAGGYHCAWMMYGLNDEAANVTAAAFQQNVLQVIQFIRTAVSDAQFPIVLETNSYSIAETAEGRHYAGALYAISQSDPNVMLINSRRVAEERFGWGTGNEWQYLSDGVHYTNAGAETMSRSSIETILDYYDAGPLPCNGDVNLSRAVDVDDLLTVINAWNWSGSPAANPADVIADGVVNIDDLLVIINSWGPCG